MTASVEAPPGPLAHVVVRPRNVPQWESLEVSLCGVSKKAYAMDLRDGGLAFDVPPGTCELSTRWPSTPSRPAQIDLIDLPAGTTELSALSDTFTVRAHVVTEQGQPAEGAIVMISGDLQYHSGMGGGITAPLWNFAQPLTLGSKGRGMWAVPHAGPWRLLAWHPKFGTAELTVTAAPDPLESKGEPPSTPLVLHPGPGLRVQTSGRGVTFYDRAAWRSGVSWPLVHVDADGGVAELANFRGKLWLSGWEGEAEVEVRDEPVTLPLLGKPRYQLQGAVVDEAGRPLPVRICAQEGPYGRGSCAEGLDGGFSITERVEEPVALFSGDPAWVPVAPVAAVPGGPPVKVVLRHFAPSSMRVVDASGALLERAVTWGQSRARNGVVRLAAPEHVEVGAPGYLSRSVDVAFGPAPAALTLSKFPLEGRVRNESGAPVVGALVSLLCEGVPPASSEAPVWASYTSCTGPTQWTSYPHGYRCTAGLARTDGRGQFLIDSVRSEAQSIEVRLGKRVLRKPFVPGAPLDFVLPE